MPNFLMLSPHYPTRLYHIARELKAGGFKVFGIGDASWNDLNEDLKNSLTEYIRLPLDCYSGKGVIDEARYDSIYRIAAGLIQRHGRLDRVESFNEFWLPLEAQIREDFNVEGPKPADLQKLIRKSLMKEVFRSVGIPVVPGELMRDLDHLKDFIRKEGVIVIKPDIGVGASDTHKIHNIQEAEVFFHSREANTEYFLERFIGGDDRILLSFDGLTDGEGNVAIAGVHPVNNGLLEIIQGDTLSYCTLRHADTDPLLKKYGESALKAFGLKSRFFHIEFFKSGETYYGLEMNSRPPGVLTLDMINHSRGINIWKQYVEVLHGRNGPIAIKRDLICSYVARVNRHEYRYSHDELLKMHGDSIVFFCNMDSPIMGDFAYLFVTETQDEREKITRDIKA